VEAYRAEAVVHEGGTIVVGGLPFRKGRRVEVILLDKGETDDGTRGYALRGEPIAKYVEPFGSVAEEDWEATG